MSVKVEETKRICKVSVSSKTTGKDVVELLKPDDEKTYVLIEIWKGCGE